MPLMEKQGPLVCCIYCHSLYKFLGILELSCMHGKWNILVLQSKFIYIGNYPWHCYEDIFLIKQTAIFIHCHPQDHQCLLVCLIINQSMYSFPRAAVTKHHKLGGLTQGEFILPQFWRNGV